VNEHPAGVTVRAGTLVELGYPDATIRKIVEIPMKAETKGSCDATFIIREEAV